MCKLLETIKIVNGKARFLEFHNARLNHSRDQLFGIQEPLDLRDELQQAPVHGVYRCRVIYGTTIEQVTYTPLEPKYYQRFKIVKADNLSYSFKFLDRTALEQLILLKEPADEVLIVKNGLITDISIANVAFYYKKQWITPAMPLLEGTTRARLLHSKRLVTAHLEQRDLGKFDKMAIMNALRGFQVITAYQII